MRRVRQVSSMDAFHRRFVSAWEDKRQRDPFLVWDGLHRWFRSKNVVPLEQYRSPEEMERIRVNVLQQFWRLNVRQSINTPGAA